MGKSIEVIVRGVVVRAGCVLLCRNDAAGYFYLPGGHVEFGESAEAALRRELVEECALDVRVGMLTLMSEGVFESGGKTHHELNLVFHVEQDAKTVTSREAGISFHWVDLASLTDVDLRPIVIKAWLMGGRSDPIAWVSMASTKEDGGAGR